MFDYSEIMSIILHKIRLWFEVHMPGGLAYERKAFP